ncbi:MAG: hypothetical protein ACI85O_002723 [Saprospiraceae bacterium]|jgi:hypothetical protein
MSKRIAFILFAILLVLDFGYAFYQFYQIPIDGDLPLIVVPIEHYQKVLTDPFGLSVLLNDEVYAAPNRFFCALDNGSLLLKLSFTSPVFYFSY